MVNHKIVSLEITNGQVLRQIIEVCRELTPNFRFCFLEDHFTINQANDDKSIIENIVFSSKHLTSYESKPQFFNRPERDAPSVEGEEEYVFPAVHILRISADPLSCFAKATKKEKVSIYIYANEPNIVYFCRGRDPNSTVRICGYNNAEDEEYLYPPTAAVPNCKVPQGELTSSLSNAIRMGQQGLRLCVYPRGITLSSREAGEQSINDPNWGVIKPPKTMRTKTGEILSTQGESYATTPMEVPVMKALSRLGSVSANTPVHIYQEGNLAHIKVYMSCVAEMNIYLRAQID